MKGSAEIEVLMTVGLILLTIFFLANFFEIITDIANALALATATAASQDLSGLVTISGAAPDEISIRFSPTDRYSYDLQIKDRLVNVRLISLNDEECKDIFRIRVDEKICRSSASTSVGDLKVSGKGNIFEVGKSKQGYRAEVTQ